MVEEQPGVREMLLEIKKNETDARLLEYYELLLPSTEK
jgi:hypothetical protein